MTLYMYHFCCCGLSRRLLFYIFVRVHAHLGMDMRCAWGLHTRKSDIVMLKVHEVVHNDLCWKYNNEYSDIVYVMMAVHVP